MTHNPLLIRRLLAGSLVLFSLAGANVSGQEAPSLVVTTADDVADPADGETSLREAIAFANSDGVDSEITFASPYFDTERIIDIDSGLPAITANTTVTGPGADLLTIFGGDVGGNGHFLHTAVRVTTGAEASITGVAFSQLHAGIFVESGGEGTVRDCEFLESLDGIRPAGDINVTTSRFVDNVRGLSDVLSFSSLSKTVNVSNCIFSGNHAGIAIYKRGTHFIANCTFENNHTGISSPIRASEITATGCVFSGNTDLAIIAESNGTINAINCTFSGGNFRGVVTSQSGIANLFNCTVSGNNIGLLDEYSSGLTLQNTIVAGNASNVQLVSSSITDAGGNIIGGTAAEAGLQTSDGVNDVVLADNGGPTRTIALVAGGRAVDGGDNSLTKDADGNDLVTDQRGQPRVQQGDATSSEAIVDVGAYELFAAPEINPIRSRFSTLNGPIDLTSLSGPTPASGTFSGLGVRDGLLDPANLPPGRHEIVYAITDGFGATNQASFFVEIFHGYLRPDLRSGDSGNAGKHRGDNQYGGGQSYRAKTQRRTHTFHFSVQNDGNVFDTLVTTGRGFSSRDFRIKVREQTGGNVSGAFLRLGLVQSLQPGEVASYEVKLNRRDRDGKARLKGKVEASSAGVVDRNKLKIQFQGKSRSRSPKPGSLFRIR